MSTAKYCSIFTASTEQQQQVGELLEEERDLLKTAPVCNIFKEILCACVRR